MRKTRRMLVVAASLVLIAALTVIHAVRILKDGAEAYLFGYSLVLMDATMQSMTDPENGRSPLNHFSHIQYFPDHNFRLVVRSNNDTLYSTAWIDLTEEPLVLSVPDTADRYYVMPFMDAWTNVFASVGKRTTGTGAGDFLVAGPDWNGNVPSDVQLIRSPTNLTWLIGRIQTNTEKDFENVAELQQQLTLTPLGRWGSGSANRAYIVNPSASEHPSDNPSVRVEQMSTGEFFSKLCSLMGTQPPAESDGPILEKLAEFGIQPGKPFDIEKLGFFRRLLLRKSVEISRRKMKEAVEQDRSSENGWTVIREGIGVYGTQYQIRSFVSLVGLGALPPEEAAYPNSRRDREGRSLSGQHRYRIHFESGQTPPVDAFWSLTVYDPNGFLVDNPIQRYAIGDRDELKVNEDGSLDIQIQHDQPDADQSNWLPTPRGDFAVTMRLYMPKAEFLDGSWTLPPIERID